MKALYPINQPVKPTTLRWRHLLLLLLLNCCSLSAFCQTKVWDKSYGGGITEIIVRDPRGGEPWYFYKGEAQLRSMVTTSDGGYLLGGFSNANSANDKSQDQYGDCDEFDCPSDFWIVKVDAAGNKVWDKTISGDMEGNRDDFLTVMVETSDGGFLLGGSSGYYYANNDDYWLVKIDANGNKLWDKFYGGGSHDRLQSLVATSDGGYLLGGTSESGIFRDKSQASKGGQDYWLVKIDASGNKVWDKTLGGGSSDALSSIVATPDGGYLLGGTSDSGIGGDKSQTSKGGQDYWLVKIDGNGNKVWDKTLGGNKADRMGDLIVMPDGSYFLGGTSESDIGGDKSQASKDNSEFPSYYGRGDYWLVKIDGIGNKVWDKTLGGDKMDDLSSMVALSDGSLLLGGSSNSGKGDDKTENPRGNSEEAFYQVDYWVIKIDDTGTKDWDRTYGGSNIDFLTTLITNPDGDYLLGGYSASGISDDKSEELKSITDYWVVKVEDVGVKDQTITFDPIPNKIFGKDPPFTLSATASSGLPVSFSIISGPATISGNVVTITGIGIVTVKASQAGNATYLPAPDLTRIFDILKPAPLTKVWDKTIGEERNDELADMVATTDGGYLLGGSSLSVFNSNGAYKVVKIDGDGNKLWEKLFSREAGNLLSSLIATADGGYLLGGSSFTTSEVSDDLDTEYDYWIIKIDANGNKIWEKIFSGNNDDVLTAMIATTDGGYLLGGYSKSRISDDKSEATRGNNFAFDYWVIKIDGGGNKIWDKVYGGTDADELTSMISTPDGGYLLGGYSASGIGADKSEANRGNNATSDYWVVKIDESGNKIWDKTFGGTGPDQLKDVVTTTDGGYLLAGLSGSDMAADKSEVSRGSWDYWIVKINGNGNKIWDKTFGGTGFDQLETIIATPDKGYLLGGFSASVISGDKSDVKQGSNDYWILKIDDNGNKLWDQTFGGTGNDQLKAIINTPDAGYLLGGFSDSGIGGNKIEANRGLTDFWIIKVKEENVPPPPPVSIWDKGYGGKSFERLTSVVKTNDGGYLLGGHSLSRNGGDRSQDTQGRYDYWIVKTDATGAQLWDKRYGGSDDDYLNQIIVTADGGYLLAGSSQSGLSGDKSQGSRGNQDFWIVKISSSGAKQWDRSYGGSGFEDLMQAVQLSTGEYVLAGVSASDISGEKSQNRRGSRDYWLLKVSATGQKLWDQRYGGSKAEELGSLVVTADGGFILGGSSLSGKSGDKSSASKGGKDYWLVKTDSQGQLLWDKSYGGNGEDQLTALATATGGALLLAGHSTSGVSGDKSSASRGSSDYWLVQVSSSGEKQWDKTYGGNAEEELASLISTQDGGWLLGGSSFSSQSGEKSQNSKGSSDYWVVKVDAEGKKQWDQTYGGAGEERLRYLLQTDDAGYLLGGFSFSNQSGDKDQNSQGRSDYWLVKIPPTPAANANTPAARLGNATPAKSAFAAQAAKLEAFPVPFSEQVTMIFTLPEQQVIRVDLYNSQGVAVKMIFEGQVEANQKYQVIWRPTSQEASGLYILQMKSKNHIKQAKIMLQR